MKRDQDITALIELLKVAAEQWPHANREISQKICSTAIDRRLICGRKPAVALASAAETFPRVIKLWKQEWAKVN
jgi:hypothetical protein